MAILLTIASPSFAGLNIALNKPTTASASQSGGSPFYAVDGDYTTMWTTGRHTDPLNPDWIKVDLGDIYLISEIVLRADYQDTYTGYRVAYVLYGSVENLLWTELGNGILPDDYDLSETIQVKRSLQYIRFNVIGPVQLPHLNEMEVYEVPEPATLLLLGLGCLIARKVKT